MGTRLSEHFKKLPETVQRLRLRLERRRKDTSVMDKDEGKVSDPPQPRLENKLEATIAEEEKQRQIDANVRLLREKILLVDLPPHESFAMRQKRRGILMGKRESVGEHIHRHELCIYYHTATGDIRRPRIEEDFDPGEYSRVIMTVTVTERPQPTKPASNKPRKINPVPIIQIAMGEKHTVASDLASDETQAILPGDVIPERLHPQEGWRRRGTGKMVYWGQAAFEEDTTGDEIMYESLAKVNKKFGKRPTRTRSLPSKKGSASNNN